MFCQVPRAKQARAHRVVHHAVQPWENSLDVRQKTWSYGYICTKTLTTRRGWMGGSNKHNFVCEDQRRSTTKEEKSDIPTVYCISPSRVRTLAYPAAPPLRNLILTTPQYH